MTRYPGAYRRENMAKAAIILLALVIAFLTFVLLKGLADSLAAEERLKMQQWADATRELATIDDGCDIGFVQSVITQNTTIPVILLTDSISGVISHRNLGIENPSDEELQALAEEFARTNPPIVINLDRGFKQYIVYGESAMLRRLSHYPLLYVGVFLLYVALLYLVFRNMKREEQNRLWVGLCKETAHQLGTPISSLMAWTDMLKEKYPGDDMLPDMEKDVQRLRIIAERFSQVGSRQSLKQEDIGEATRAAADYIRRRISKKISLEVEVRGEIRAMLNAPLYEWVIENLCKNAADAMEGSGEIKIEAYPGTPGRAFIDVSDTGKGIPPREHGRIFAPGYTTKQRGWGLGLSLSKRIIEEYHGGKIYVKRSEPGRGTTFRIELPAEQEK